MAKVGITETVLRDAHQSLIATRMTTAEMLPIIEKMDKDADKKLNLNQLITIIMPVKNGENYVQEAIDGIKSQSMNIEIIVVDDGSDDNTVNIAQAAGCKVLHHEISKGQVVAKNTGLKEAKGKFVMFHDHDDVLTPKALSIMHEEFQKDKSLEVVIAKIKDFVSPDCKDKAQSVKPEGYWGALGGSLLIKKEVFNKIGFFDENLSAGEIISLTSKFVEHGIKTKKIDYNNKKRKKLPKKG